VGDFVCNTRVATRPRRFVVIYDRPVRVGGLLCVRVLAGHVVDVA
jgi:hypothetical protein